MKMRKRYRSGFTLIELLIVMMIIGILSTLVFVAVDKVQKAAKKARAKIEVKQLEKAFVSYFDEYGEWPIECLDYDDGKRPEDFENHTGIQIREDLAKLLSGKNSNDENPQEIVFFDIPESRIRTDNDDTIGFVDPWNYCYKCMMDFNDDGTNIVKFTSDISTNQVSGLGVAVWSQGPDGDDQFEKDNITSWKLQ